MLLLTFFEPSSASLCLLDFDPATFFDLRTLFDSFLLPPSCAARCRCQAGVMGVTARLISDASEQELNVETETFLEPPPPRPMPPNMVISS